MFYCIIYCIQYILYAHHNTSKHMNNTHFKMHKDNLLFRNILSPDMTLTSQRLLEITKITKDYCIYKRLGKQNVLCFIWCS